ncbi:MAG: MerR family transcriptional regulator [Hyphomicrobiales bacterium]
MDKSPEAFRTISEVAEDLDVPKHVLRFWEVKFSQLKPMKRGGGRRYYRPEDVDLLKGIRQLLYSEGYTIKGVQRILREQGIRYVMDYRPPAAEKSSSVVIHRNIPDIAADARHAPEEEDDEDDFKTEDDAGSMPSEIKVRLRALLSDLEACREILRSAKE